VDPGERLAVDEQPQRGLNGAGNLRAYVQGQDDRGGAALSN
jgi:hypothetical protein